MSSLELFATEVMPEFHDLEGDHQEWKQAVLNGELELEDLSTKGFGMTAVAAANPEMARLREANQAPAG